MPWLKVDDKMYTNPKVHPLGSEAFRINMGGLMHSASQLTDGYVNLPALFSLLVPDMRRKPQYYADELADAGLWIPDGDGGWVINDYLEYNPSREKVLADRAADAARKAEARAKRNGSRNP